MASTPMVGGITSTRRSAKVAGTLHRAGISFTDEDGIGVAWHDPGRG